jgi:cytochrome b subunit of formate dehydrogenase
MRNWLLIASCMLGLAAAAGSKEPPKLDCLGCHNDPSLTSDSGGKTHGISVDPGKFKGSVHGSLECADCHGDVRAFPHDPAPAKVNCGSCHAETQASYEHGVHAAARAKGVSQAATCSGCHGDPHAILPASDPKSKTNRSNIPQTCGACHGVKFVMEGQGLSTQQFFSYQQSVHGKAVAAGSGKAAVCTDCHRAHDILAPNDAKSPIFKFNVPSTCGQCHQEVARAYVGSIHGQAIARGNWQAPVCTDCHGIHLIKAHIDPSSSVAAQALARTTCAQCHEGVRLTQEMGIPSARAATYLDSYHGLASQLDSKVVANCASCHGVHNILPSSDPRSMVNKSNLVKTCGQCHPGASQNFAQAQVHIGVPLSRDIGSLGTAWVRRFYLVLILVTIGGMLVHNGILWGSKVRERRRRMGRTVVRMSRAQRAQHWTLLSSFLFLAVTGFALKYPESPLAWLLGSSESFRRYGHRVAAVVLMAMGAYHLLYLWRSREGRQVLRDFIPKLKDLRDFLGTMLYHLGRSREHPRFGRFTYAEKLEYLAMVWGTALMGATGFMLWFKVGVGWLLPRWSVDIAGAIHFYEAILAVLAIAVWHFYHVMFDPDVYPIDLAFWDGKVSEERYKEHHPLAYEQMFGPPEKETQEEEKEQEPKPAKQEPPKPEPEQQ